MQTPKPYRFGLWPSSLDAEAVARGSLRFGRIQTAGPAIYWSEGRPREGGRTAIVRWTPYGGCEDLVPEAYSARSRVHEYGGGEFLLADETLFFVNDADQDIYALNLSPSGGDVPDVRRLTRAGTRFADLAYDPKRGLLIAVGERHGGTGGTPDIHPQNALYALPLRGPGTRQCGRFVEGRDFYANPRISADGSKLAFLAWDLPNMPWDAAALYTVALAADGTGGEPVHVAGGGGSACFQPEWGADGALYFVWDADGFGNLYRSRDDGTPRAVTSLDAELSMPMWSLNAKSYVLLPDGGVYLSYVRQGQRSAGYLDPHTGALTPSPDGVTSLQTLDANAEGIVSIAMTDRLPPSVIRHAAAGGSRPTEAIAAQVLRCATGEPPALTYASAPRQIEMTAEDGSPLYGTYYPPLNPAAGIVPDTPPPLIVSLHGGPTSAAARGFKLRTQFFTSRGFAWLDLDYAGSVGYGRAYRDRLKGHWGVRDVTDTIAAAAYASATGLADAGNIFVTGGSAGGYTVLMAIASSNLFRGAASHYGICDLASLQRSTHKFEQGYLRGLLGAALEDDEALYRERSPLAYADRIATPLILFQGAEDRVVPKEQAIRIATALTARGAVAAYHEFEGEGHGFRKEETIRAVHELELSFFISLLQAAGDALETGN